MRILLVHNYYQQSGGEDTVFQSERALLREHGHTVTDYVEHNDRIAQMNKISVATRTLWSQPSFKRLSALIQHERPDVVHFHNTFPLISPAAYYACHRARVPVVQSLHNPRLLCPAASFYRDGRLCQDCLGRTPAWPGILHACYRGSRLQTAAVASMLTLHRWLKTWHRRVDLFIVFTEFYRHKFIEGGLPANKIVVKPHFIHSGPGFDAQREPGEYALFIGRLDPEKGVRTMLEAWTNLDIPLKIRGDGQLEAEVRDFLSEHRIKSVELVGRLSKQELARLIQRARFLVWPSEGYYETFGLVAVECYAAGVPVIASRTGVMRDIVQDRATGALFHPGDPTDLARTAAWAWANPEETLRMGRRARREFENKYTPERNYSMLMKVYERVREHEQSQETAVALTRPI